MENTDVYEEIKDIIGPEAAKQLADHYSGSSLYIPKRIAIQQQHRDIREEFSRGTSYRELAIRYGYTDRHIRRIVHTKEKV